MATGILQSWKERQRIRRLARAMAIVDEYMVFGLEPEKLDHNYGRAYADIRMEYINGDLTMEETRIVLVMLDNQYHKMRAAAERAVLYA